MQELIYLVKFVLIPGIICSGILYGFWALVLNALAEPSEFDRATDEALKLVS